MWYLAGLVWIAVMVYIVSRYTRRQRRRSSDRTTEMAALLANLKANPRAALEGLEQTAAPAVTAAAAPAFNRKPRLLPQPAALLYYVFRTGLPDHEIFAGMALSDAVDIAPAAAGVQHEQLTRRLAQQRLDLVVCNKQLEVVAVVMVKTAAAGSAAEEIQFATHCLQAAGIRAVSIDPAALPRHNQVHALVYG